MWRTTNIPCVCTISTHNNIYNQTFIIMRIRYYGAQAVKTAKQHVIAVEEQGNARTSATICRPSSRQILAELRGEAARRRSRARPASCSASPSAASAGAPPPPPPPPPPCNACLPLPGVREDGRGLGAKAGAFDQRRSLLPLKTKTEQDDSFFHEDSWVRTFNSCGAFDSAGAALRDKPRG